MESRGTSRRKFEDEYNEMMGRIGVAFGNDQGFANAQNYIKCLLGSAERKNGWQMSEYLGAGTPYQMQQFIYRGRYDADEIMWIAGEYVMEALGEADGVMVLDETGFIKQGKKSCGVARQYTGTSGKVDNCQVGVFLTYAGGRGHGVIDRRLYMPREWMEDAERLRGAGVPESVAFQTKAEIGMRMLEKAEMRGMAYGWATGDSVYGDSEALRGWLEENGKWYVLAVKPNSGIWEDNKETTIANAMKGMSGDKWVRASCGDGSKGAREYEWATAEAAKEWREAVNRLDGAGEWERVLLARRSLGDRDDMQAYICHCPRGTAVGKLVEVAGTRWTVETCFREANV